MLNRAEDEGRFREGISYGDGGGNGETPGKLDNFGLARLAARLPKMRQGVLLELERLFHEAW